MAPINLPDGTEVSEVILPDGASASEVIAPDGSTVFSPGPSGESFEHNDLTGVYGGDTGNFAIQTGTVIDGTYALAAASSSRSSIVRKTTNAFARSGLEITWQQYFTSNGGVGGVAVATAVTGQSNFDGYHALADAENSNHFLSRIDNGSGASIANDFSVSFPTGQWLTGSMSFFSNGDIEIVLNNSTLTANDTTYTNLLLGFVGEGEVFVDDVSFSEI